MWAKSLPAASVHWLMAYVLDVLAKEIELIPGRWHLDQRRPANYHPVEQIACAGEQGLVEK